MCRIACRVRLIWAILVMATLMFASHWHVAPSMPNWDLFDFDKFAHFCIYGLLATLIARAFYADKRKREVFLIAWAATVGFGLIDELIQAMNPVRDFSLADLLADALGAALALTLYLSWPLYRRVLEWTLFSRKAIPTTA